MPFFDAINHGHYVSRLYIFYQVFFSPQVKGSAVITNKHVSWPAQYTAICLTFLRGLMNFLWQEGNQMKFCNLSEKDLWY